jgi:DNA polymerase-3 subunit alpha
MENSEQINEQEPVLDTHSGFDNNMEEQADKNLDGMEERRQEEPVRSAQFTHLHLHTQYSLLDGASNIDRMLEKAKKMNMSAIAMTDHGNMFGVPYFVKAAKKAGIKPIIGCEVYIAKDSRFEKKKVEGKHYYHLIILAKNKTGYHNLAKLVSRSFLEGFYYKPRIDKELLEELHEGLIVSSACLGGEIPQLIMQDKLDEAQKAVEWYKTLFGEDYYLELQNHNLPEQHRVNSALKVLGEKNNVKLIATNDVHFINREDREAHKILINLSTGLTLLEEQELIQKGKAKLSYTGEEFLKSEEEMLALFADYPEAVANTMEIAAKVEEYNIFRDVILPVFELPQGFEDQKTYLRHLTYEGAKIKYGEITDEITKRLEYELNIIETMGFEGYFLIVQDFIKAAKKMGVKVGPGRGSAAGSAVAYATDITNIDPIKYDLLFERFLNPERVTMPDVDVDFDDDGRDKVLQYVVNKYGKDHVAQLITFGKMGPKTAIRDVARVLSMPIPDADKLAKMIPDTPGMTFKKAYKEAKELADVRKSGTKEQIQVLELAEILEGSVRHTGKHACGVIIGPEALEEHIPLATAKDADLMVTQYDGKFIEDVGMLKMDFLGLKTLSIINDALEIIKKQYGKIIDIDMIPLDDSKTFELFQRGDTTAIFQFESPGMQKNLKELKPTDFEDLVAMNSLYRPGPMDFIPSYIKRKHGVEEIASLDPLVDTVLENTFGIMVYQEQIMKVGQLMGGFTLGQADILRRAMGKKKMDVMETMKLDFIKGAQQKGVEEKKARDVFKVMEKFAEYGFNRSHSAAYALIAYQTAYLKAHYPAALMAATLTHNLKDLDKITFFIKEAQRLDIPVLGPDINESEMKFTVNKKGEIRFGLVAIKNVGEKAVEKILQEKENAGDFQDFFDFVKRVDLKAVNKRSIESLAKAGAFDSFGMHRAQYFYQKDENSPLFLETVMRFGNQYQAEQNSLQNSLFGAALSELKVENPPPPDCSPWSETQKLDFEKQVTGFYISGHPLDKHKYVFDHFVSTDLETLRTRKSSFLNKTVYVAGMITSVSKRYTKKGDKYGVFSLEDFGQKYDFFLFSEEFLKNEHFLTVGQTVFLTLRVVKNKYNENINVNVSRFMLLSEVLDKLTSQIEVLIPLMSINDDMTDRLNRIIRENKGEIPVTFHVYSIFEKHLKVNFLSGNSKVSPFEFLKYLEKDLNLEFRLKKK